LLHYCSTVARMMIFGKRYRMLTFFVAFALCAWVRVSAVEEGYCQNTDGQECAPAEKPTTVKIAKGANEDGRPPTVDRTTCDDRVQQCPGFAANGECDRNPGWMIVNCPKSCRACDLRDSKVRCDRQFLNISTDPVYQPGDMNSMFENIETEFSQLYDVNVISKDPWVVTFDNFLNDDEVDALITTVAGNWERSTDTGQANEFGETGRTISKGRTSSNAWCRHNCISNPHVQSAIRKIEDVTRIPKSHYESFQILQYEEGQFYNVHHDMGQ